MNENVLESEEAKFMKQYYPQAYTEFLLYQRRDRLPKVGSTVFILLDKFYHTCSDEMKIIEINDNYIIVENWVTTKLIHIDEWWKNIRILKEVE